MKLIFLSVVFFYIFTPLSAQFLVKDLTEFKAALSKVQPGDEIVWKNGIYKDVKINFKVKNASIAGKPIILKAETAGKVILTGSSQLVVDGHYLQAQGFMFDGPSTLDKGDVMAFSSNASNCRITNCAVKNYIPKDELVNNNWISIQGNKNELDHCYFSGKTNQGPYLVVRYKTAENFIAGSDTITPTHHHIHHNYFGYRTLPTDNGGEDMRIGDSKTSFTHGFNIIEYNYFEEQRLEPEVISNKSWDNIYRFNTFMNNDGSMVLRHGQKCFVYGNYFSGKTGRKMSGGIRIINPNQTVFNNYLEDLEGGNNDRKAPICIMSGLQQSAINEYYPADSALIFYNTIYNCVGPAIMVGEGNATKGKPFVTAKNVMLTNNIVINPSGKNNVPVLVKDTNTTYLFSKNIYSNANNLFKGFAAVNASKLLKQNGFVLATIKPDVNMQKLINARLAVHNIALTEKQMTVFDRSWKLKKQSVGVTWIK